MLAALQGVVALQPPLLLLVSHNLQLSQSLVVQVVLQQLGQLPSRGALGGAPVVRETKVVLLIETAAVVELATLGVAVVQAQMVLQLAAAVVGAQAG